MKEEDRNALIHKYLREECSPAEKRKLEQWLAESEQNQVHFDQIALIERESRQIDFSLETNTKEEWQKLRAAIQPGQEAKMDTAARTAGGLIVSFRPYWKVAAALAVVVAVGALLMTQFFELDQRRWAQQLEAPKGSTRQLDLADGTTVKLNAGSKLAVDRRYNRRERRVKLEGEAFFEVTEDADRPFIVQSGEVLARVLGTAFNLAAYPETGKVALTVTEGRVRLYREGEEGLTLEAGASGIFDLEAKTFQEEEHDPQRSLAWLDGRLVFKDDPLEFVLSTLERRYDVQIINRSGLSDIPYTDSSTEKESLEEVLDRLAVAFGLEVEMEGRVITLTRK